MPFVETAILINGSPKEAYTIAKDMEQYPQFMENVKEIKVQERLADSTITAWVTDVDGRILKWREKDIFDDDNLHISYNQIDGDLKKFAGEWLFAKTNTGTEVKLTVDFELGIPMISGLINPLLIKKTRSNCQAMLLGIKEKVEKTKNVGDKIWSG